MDFELDQLPLTLDALAAAYKRGLNPQVLLQWLDAREADWASRNIWIHRLSPAEREPYLERLAGRSPDELPLYGVPFAIKDNIDLAGIPTTAACPAYAYTPQRSASIVSSLVEAGAIPLGKTNLDQFATGLVGARSPEPWGPCRNAFDASMISGGSSAGSAVAVAAGLASFSLGTDTAGSGRVPAAFNNLVGLKPSCGTLSTEGVVPACQSLDSVSLFTLTASDASTLYSLCAMAGRNAPFARQTAAPAWGHVSQRIAVPLADQLVFDSEADRERFSASCAWLESLDYELLERDFSLFFDTARMLYEGPWVAERYSVVRELLDGDADCVHKAVREVLGAAPGMSATDAFEALYLLEDARVACRDFFAEGCLALTPTAPGLPRLAAVLADPLGLNSRLGTYTNFMNLLDLAGIALPAGFTDDGTPRGITLFGPAGSDALLLHCAGRYLDTCSLPLGATGLPRPAEGPLVLPESHIPLVVCGAHMSGLPLNEQLVALGGFWLESVPTARAYRLFALPGGPPERPGLVRTNDGGVSVETETWALPRAELGRFMASIPAPLGLGQVELVDGRQALGFLCEASATEAALDVSNYGGWRAYLASRA
ncbi:MAG: allophanate hydrolase [Pseudomonadota bacterium]